MSNTDDKQEKTLHYGKQFPSPHKRFPKGVRCEVWSSPDAKCKDGKYYYFRLIAPGIHMTTGLLFEDWDERGEFTTDLFAEVLDLFSLLVGDNPELVGELEKAIREVRNGDDNG